MSEKVRIDNNLNTILWFVRQALVDAGACTLTTGYIGQNPQRNAVPPSTNYLVITARKQDMINAETQTWLGELTVRCWTYSAVDIAMQDYFNLTQSTGNGLQNQVNSVISALNMLDLNTGAAYLLAYPMRYTRQDDEHRENESDSPTVNWSYVDVAFEIVYGEDPTYVNPAVNSTDEYSYEYDPSFN